MFLLLLSSPYQSWPYKHLSPELCWSPLDNEQGWQRTAAATALTFNPLPCLPGICEPFLEGPVLSSFCPLPYCLLPLPGELVLSFLLLFFPRGREERGGERRFCPRGEKRWYWGGAEAGKAEGYLSKVGWLNPKHPTGVSVQGEAKGSTALCLSRPESGWAGCVGRQRDGSGCGPQRLLGPHDLHIGLVWGELCGDLVRRWVLEYSE